MEDYRLTLRRVGNVLIVFGILDVLLMIYCIIRGKGYSSSFNIFAIIAGVLLKRGGLLTARIVTFFSAFFMSCFIGLMICFPLLVPHDLLLVYFRVKTISFSLSLLLAVSVIILLGWVYYNLTRTNVVSALIEKHPILKSNWLHPRNGFIPGVLFIALLFTVLAFALNTNTAKRAIVEAKQKTGDGYSYFVSSISVRSSGRQTHCYAGVQAYNRNEIKEVEVEWDE